MALSLDEALGLAGKSGFSAPRVAAGGGGGDDSGIFGTGKNILFKALETVDAPRRAIASTLQETIDAAQGEGFSFSDWKEQFQDTEFGVGKILANEDLLQGDEWWERWGARAAGFTGDVLLDPLTYATAGSAKVVQIGRRGLSHRAWNYADDIKRGALKVADDISPDDLVRVGSKIEQLGLSSVDNVDLDKLARAAVSAGDIDAIGQLSGGLHFTLPGTGRVAQRVSKGRIQPISARFPVPKGKKAGSGVTRFVQRQRQAGRQFSKESKVLQAFGGADGTLKKQLAFATDPNEIKNLRRVLDSQGNKRLIIESVRDESMNTLLEQVDQAGGLTDEVIDTVRESARAFAKDSTKVVETLEHTKNLDKLASTNVDDVWGFISNMDSGLKSRLRAKIADGGKIGVNDFGKLEVGQDFLGVKLRAPGGSVPSLKKQAQDLIRDLPQSFENLLSTDLRTAFGANLDVLAHRAGEAWQTNKLLGLDIFGAVEKIDSRLARVVAGADLPVGALDEDTAAALLAKFGDELVYLTPEQALDVREHVFAHADEFLAKHDEAREAAYNWAERNVDEMQFNPGGMEMVPENVAARLETNLDRLDEMVVNNPRRLQALQEGRVPFTDPDGLELDFRLQAQGLGEEAAGQRALMDEAQGFLDEARANPQSNPRLQATQEASLQERIDFHRGAWLTAEEEAMASLAQADEAMRQAGREKVTKRFAPLLERARTLEDEAIERGVASAGRATADEVQTLLQNPDILDAVNNLVIPDSMRMINWDAMAPEDYIDGIRQVSRMRSPEAMRDAIKHYDNALNAFKAAALLSPGFHFRNLFGGVFNNWLGGVDQSSYGKVARMLGEKGQEEGVKGFASRRSLTRFRGALANVDAQDREIFEALENHSGVLSTGGLYANETDVTGALLLGDVSRNPFSSRGRLALANRRLGGNVEDMLRMTIAFDTMKKGGTITDAINNVFKYHFDYSDLSTFEQSVVRRVFPFYTWTRKNLPLQIENFVTQPGKYTRYLAAKRNIEMFQEEEEIVPSYYKELLAIQLPVEINGVTQYLTPDLPFRDTLDLIDDPGDILGSVSPFLRIPAERFAGKEFFSGIPLRDKYVEVPNTLEWLAPAAATLGVTARHEDGTWMIRDKNLKAIEGFLPLAGRARRMDPWAEGNDDRWWASSLSTLFGIGFRSNDERAQSGERWARELRERELEADRKALTGRRQ